MAKLTEKQKIFVNEYLIDLNATQAAIRAGYKPSSARQVGTENMSKPSIRACIDQAIAERSKRTGINQDRVIRELARLAFVNASDVIDMDEASIKCNASEDDTAAIASVKVKTIPTKEGDGVEREIRLNDKLKALELLGKHLGMFKDNININANVSSTKKLDAILEQLGDDGNE